MQSTGQRTTIIRPTRGWSAVNVSELWAHRELLYFLAWRDVRVRYKQTVFGMAWAVLQPLLLMIVFALFFGRLARIPSDGIPYAIFAYAALVPWTLFARSVDGAASSLVRSSDLISKIYFPRLLMPLGSVIAVFFDFAISVALLLVMVLVYGESLSFSVLTLPLFGALAAVIALGVGVLLAAINARFRDVQNVTPFLIQLGLFASPVVYPLSLVPERWRVLYGLNPMVGVIEGFRWALFRGSFPTREVVSSVLVMLVLLMLGTTYFRKVERTFADII